ncbi:MAG: flavin reductase family protein [Planctomycetes bacterium]|nr:flavin reductase family protein [Planctomycetota bacterium]
MHTTDPHKSLGAALGRIPSGIFILTAARGGVETGMLASWIQQCAFVPPTITFVVQRGRPIGDLLGTDAPFTINILEAAQTDMIAHFGKGFSLEDNAFLGLAVRDALPYGPILEEGHAYLLGKVQDRIPVGDHDLYLAEITAGSLLEEGQPMVHVRKNGFHY